jgi:hypothetical protein
MEINITIPALLFSAISLLVLAFTNRFLSLAQLVRSLHDQYKQNPNKSVFEQIRNLRKRLYLIKITQIAGLASLLLCVISMFLIYIDLHIIAEILFGIALVCLSTSLSLSIWEIQISVHALDLHLDDMEMKE